MSSAEPLALAEMPYRTTEQLVESRLAVSFRCHGYIVPSFLLALVVCARFVPWGDWKFFAQEDFCGFYDAQALSMLDGGFDVPPVAIGDEAFNFQRKAYGDFVLGPARLRIPLVVAFESME